MRQVHEAVHKLLGQHFKLAILNKFAYKDYYDNDLCTSSQARLIVAKTKCKKKIIVLDD